MHGPGRFRGSARRRARWPGPASVAELQEAVGGSSAGQVYHHLSTLAAAGVAEAVGGGRHRVPPTAVVPLLVGLLAAADVGGVLG